LKGKKSFSNRDFWLKYQSKLPYLTEITLILMNVPVSSAFIERFFSICGIVCKSRSGSMGDDLIINRSLLKANLETLNSLNDNDEEENE